MTEKAGKNIKEKIPGTEFKDYYEPADKSEFIGSFSAKRSHFFVAPEGEYVGVFAVPLKVHGTCTVETCELNDGRVRVQFGGTGWCKGFRIYFLVG